MLHPDLPTRLKAATAGLHHRAERSGVMAALLARRLSREGYAALLAELLVLYEALEAALDRHRGEPRLAGLWSTLNETLRRTPALAADARHFGARPPACAATRAYTARIATASARAPHRLAAHAYVRYLGDLHGGQILRRLLREHFALDGDDGTRFHRFGTPAEAAALRHGLRAALAALPLAPAEADEVIAEACWAFEAHVRLFDELVAVETAESPAATHG